MSAPAVPLAAGSILVLLIATLEGLVLSFVARQPYDWRAYFTSLADAVGRGLIRALPLGLVQALFLFLWEHRLYTMPMSAAGAWVLLFVGQELCYYWMHRADHRIRWLWANHAVHHSPNHLNLSAAYRLGWTQGLSGGALFFAPLVLIGFHPVLVVGALAANLLYQFWLHTEWIPKLGPLEWVLNTPSHHRVHHASNAEYLDANFGGVLIVFDRLFGTFVAERDDVPCRYGLTQPLRTYNPLKIAFHEWLAMGRDVLRARDLREAVGYLFGPPGWRPSSLRAIDDEPRELRECVRARP
jgi:sterol desaturase/sphingolipid hydroxylase (fatty acid hydroxylase superfamily)